MTKSKIIPAILVASLAIPVAACSIGNTNAGTEIKQSDASQKIEIGKTTKQQIYLDFGEPTKTSDGEKTFFYSWTKGSHFTFLGMGTSGAVGNTLVIIFDKDGIVKDYRITRGAVDNTAVN